jgi:hypothetical protein
MWGYSMDANQIIKWHGSWWGMKLVYQDDEIVALPINGELERTKAVMHSAFVRTSEWFCCVPYSNHDVNFPSIALLAYLEQKDVKQCYSTPEQRKATEIAIRFLVRRCSTNPNYFAYDPRKRRMNDRVKNVVEKIVRRMAGKKEIPTYTWYDSADGLLNFLNDEGYSRCAVKLINPEIVTERLF